VSFLLFELKSTLDSSSTNLYEYVSDVVVIQLLNGIWFQHEYLAETKKSIIIEGYGT